MVSTRLSYCGDPVNHIASIKKKTTIKLVEDVVAAFKDSSNIVSSAGDGASGAGASGAGSVASGASGASGDGDSKLLFPVLGFASQQSDAAHVPVAHVTPVNVSFK